MIALLTVLLAQAGGAVPSHGAQPPADRRAKQGEVPANVRCIKDSFGNYTCTDGSRVIQDSFGNVTVIPGRR